MQFLQMWNPFTFVGRDIASRQQVETTVRELFNSKPHLTATLGISLAAVSAALGGNLGAAISATSVATACLLVRIVLERRFLSRSPGEMDSKWIRVFVYGSLMSGFGWGLSSAILFHGGSPETQAITMAVACAVMQGAAGRAYMMPGTALWNIALVIGQMSIVAFAGGQYLHIPAFLLYFVFLTAFIMQMVENRLRQLHAEQMADRLFHEVKEKNELLRIANETLATKAYEDPLTGLANRRKFDLCFDESLAAAARNATPISLMILDVDHFKAFNDTYGHQSGDECLRLITRALSSTIADPGSLVARYGGEEFVVILPGQDMVEAKIVAEKARIAVRLTSLDSLPGTPPRQTISIGLVTSTGGSQTTRDAMLAAADAALYEAKKRGRNRVCSYCDIGEAGEQLPVNTAG
ncbi:GGDEF domain-containing protein [uncultured Hoeflea sp.]|uniref:GGDEF domain-containing protein n=1 Tax=uncultured Hoeflea sp. TaxID=538666 RepID=UPI0030ED6AF3|tara:strand:+ start:149860 stop:151086 length:1227 start_codon:yes stop_codon:yes gene_type:complete